MLTSQIVKQCERCSNILNECQCTCYAHPGAFIRDNGMFMCPIKRLDDYKEPVAQGRVRVGQQKQKVLSFKQSILKGEK